MDDFDPDAYLAEFDPDAYLAEFDVTEPEQKALPPVQMELQEEELPYDNGEPTPATLVKLRQKGKWTVSNDQKLTRAEKVTGKLLEMPKELVGERPTKRSHCERGQEDDQPCPWISCKYNTYLTVSPDGAITFHHPEIEPWEVAPGDSCVLDMIDREGEMTMVRIAEVFGVTRSRVQQIEVEGAQRAKESGIDLEGVSEHLGGNSADEVMFVSPLVPSSG